MLCPLDVRDKTTSLCISDMNVFDSGNREQSLNDLFDIAANNRLTADHPSAAPDSF